MRVVTDTALSYPDERSPCIAEEFDSPMADVGPRAEEQDADHRRGDTNLPLRIGNGDGAVQPMDFRMLDVEESGAILDVRELCALRLPCDNRFCHAYASSGMTVIIPKP